mmetsp:Transcript_6130/g.6684  ORF Transcript_6130/g.6684 Transcript_6130/m.6684 type:complete len:199 (-) Transcript_6130:35-631(-)
MPSNTRTILTVFMIYFAALTLAAYNWKHNPFPDGLPRKFGKVDEFCFHVDETLVEFPDGRKCGFTELDVCVPIEREGGSLGIHGDNFRFIRKDSVDFDLPLFCMGETVKTRGTIGQISTRAFYKDEELTCEAGIGELSYQAVTTNAFNAMSRLLPDAMRGSFGKAMSAKLCSVVGRYIDELIESGAKIEAEEAKKPEL